MLTIETQKAYNKNNTSCFQENTGISLPLGRPPGRALRLRLRALPDSLPRGNNIPYFPESMKYYYSTFAQQLRDDLGLRKHAITSMIINRHN